VRDPVRALVEVAEREAAIAGDQRGAIGHRVGHGLEQVGKVELHPATLPTTPGPLGAGIHA
jgi:hypothetical protein